MSTLDPINYKNLTLKVGLLVLPLSWVMVPALVSMNSFGVWNILRFLPLKCPLVIFFGIQCPTCGLGRSLIYAWSGNFSLSLHYHFLGIVIYLSSFLFFLWLGFRFELKKQLVLISLIEQKSLLLYKKIPKALWIVLLITYCLWGFNRKTL